MSNIELSALSARPHRAGGDGSNSSHHSFGITAISLRTRHPCMSVTLRCSVMMLLETEASSGTNTRTNISRIVNCQEIYGILTAAPVHSVSNLGITRL